MALDLPIILYLCMASPKMSPLPRMAMTRSPSRISMEPRETKKRALRRSPRWTNVSPGGAWVVLN